MGELPPIWGRYGSLKFLEIWRFWRTLSSIISKCYRYSRRVSANRHPSPTTNLKIWRNSDENNLRKVQSNLANLLLDLVGLEYFQDSEAVYNGLMVRLHLSRAVTVRDRPQMYLESNRKPGSKSWFFGSPPYFYFLFGIRGPQNAIFGGFLTGVAPSGAVVPY